MTNLRSLDLNLLTVFEAVFEAGSITRAADRLALSQSATSHALGRLREACNDDLFVRLGQGIAPTPVAARIFPEVKACLDGLRRAVAEARGFDPAASTRRFRIAIPHPSGPLWALAFRAAVAAEAPGLTLDFDTRTLPHDLAEGLRGGEIDLAVDWIPAEGERFVNRRLFEDHLVCLARGAHPRVGAALTPEALRAERFVRVHRRPDQASEAVRAARALGERLGLAWVLDVSEFLEVPYVVLATDLLGFVPASTLRAAGPMTLLREVALPEPMPPIPIHLLWHETRRADDGHRWLRDRLAAFIAGTVRDAQAPPPA
jgi:DNA-binding transcriptional LysR family regulator